MPAELLLDTGALVALLDIDESRHQDCISVLDDWSGPIVTTEAVLIETLYLVRDDWRAQQSCLEFFLREAVWLVPASTTSLRRVSTLMQKYRDIPMDFADATLVALAEELDSDRIFTLDRRGFSAYRMNRQKAFHILP